jgi:glycosyltransferase involved in cell wall biosynthesis
MPDLDIIVTTYNGAEHLDECLASVCAQTWGDFAVLVIDNASTDDTTSIVARWVESDPRVTYLCNERNVGHTASANRAYKRTSAEYVLQLHGDDALAPTFLEEVLEHGLKRHPECPFAYSLFSRLIGGRPTGDIYQFIPDLPTGVHPVLGYLCFTNWIIQSFAVFRRAAFDRVGGFERHIARFRSDDAVAPRGGFVDHYMWARLATLGPAYVSAARLGYYRIHQSHESSLYGQATQQRRLVQEAVRTYDYIFDDHDLFNDITRYMAKVNQMGRLLTDNGLVKTALEMVRSTETGPEITPYRKGFMTAIHSALKDIIFDAPEDNVRYVLEHPSILDVFADSIRKMPDDGVDLWKRTGFDDRGTAASTG